MKTKQSPQEVVLPLLQPPQVAVPQFSEAKNLSVHSSIFEAKAPHQQSNAMRHSKQTAVQQHHSHQLKQVRPGRTLHLRILNKKQYLAMVEQLDRKVPAIT